MKKSPNSAAFLSRFQASMYLEILYRRYLKKITMIDTETPDWYSILSENGRDPLCLSAVKKGYPRGNRAAYAQLCFFRIGGRPCYIKADIEKWFSNHFESRVLSRAA